jgi:hypothetical protein
MEFAIFAAIIIPLFIASIFLTGKSNQKRKGLFESNLLEKMGSSDLDEIYRRELKPAVAALAKRDFFAVTAHFIKLEDKLTSIAFETKLGGALQWDGNDRYAYTMLETAREKFLQEHKLFEPEDCLDEFGLYTAAVKYKFGKDWIAGNHEIFPLSNVTDIEVFSEGQKIVNFTSRASLGSAALGAVLPGSSLLWAMARPKVTKHEEDDRESCILIIGKDFEMEIQVDPDEVKDARLFAKRLQRQVEINKGLKPSDTTAKKAPAKSKAKPQKGDVGVSLEKLTEMYAAGLITADEFAALKEKL